MEPNQMQINELERNDLSWLRLQSVEVRLEIVNHHLTICQMYLNELFEEEVVEKAGARYSHNKPQGGAYSRWGYNPGSVKVGDHRIKMDIPRIRNNETKQCEPLDRYQQVRSNDQPTEQLIKGVLLGLSMRDYDGVVDYLNEGFGMSKSSVSRSFKVKTSEKLEEFENRRFDQDTFVGLFIDGKYLASEQIIIVLGVTNQGVKVPLGFIQSHSEHSGPISDLLSDLVSRGLGYDQGLLVVIDGSKGLKKAVKDVFGRYAVIQRCTWHKRENVKNYLKEEDQQWFTSDYHKALDQNTYKAAKADIDRLIKKIEPINRSAANSLKEASEEILTLHKLKLHSSWSRTFATTNVIENVNSQLVKYIRKVRYWKTSDMRYRWVAAGLIEIEKNMRKINNYRKLPELEKAINDYISAPSRKPRISTKIGT